MEKEIWKDIFGYEGLYQVSNLGRVKALRNKSHKKEYILTPRKHSHGYSRVSLSKNGKEKDFYIHRLVANAFLPKIDGMTEVNHRDGLKERNCVDNLGWANRQTNELHKLYVLKHGNTRAVRCVETGQVFPSISKAAQSLGLNEANLVAHLKNKPKHNHFGTFHWEYVEPESNL